MTDYTIYVRQVYNGPIEVGDKGGRYILKMVDKKVVQLNPRP